MNSIYRWRLGDPEPLTPITVRPIHPCLEALDALPEVVCPFEEGQIVGEQRGSTYTVRLPLSRDEQIFGFGLQLKSLNQTGKKRTVRANADPVADTGDSHAPVPFYVSTAGYGVLVDSARYVTFHTGRDTAAGAAHNNPNAGPGQVSAPLEMLIEVPGCQGVDIYVFAGQSLSDAVCRYNLFSGGGALPPLWGLGIWYRAYTGHDAARLERMMEEFRAESLPLDVLGLEPGWQTHAYPSSFVWDRQRMPDPGGFIGRMARMGIRVNLWQHCFTHSDSPIYDALAPYSGDYPVWGGRTPDLALPETRTIFGGYQDRELAGIGVSGFKMDECDGSDYTGGWSFPNTARFPSGLDGEQMHSLLGLLYQDTLVGLYEQRGLRSFHLVRNSHALAADRPAVLYSDLYDHRDFIRGVVTMGFSGLLWTPELRSASGVEDMVRRLQTLVFSPMAQINAWSFALPPWHQTDADANNKGILMPRREEATDRVRELFRLRMSLIPYLYGAFMQYRLTGRPPFRALVMDHPGDDQTYGLDDEYMMGEDILVAPLTAQSATRRVYLPKGKWHDFFTGEALEGGWHEVECPLDRMPVYVRDNTLLPLAQPMTHVGDGAVFTLTPRVFGEDPRPAVLWEDDGVSLDGRRSRCILARTDGHFVLTREDGSAPWRYQLH